MNLIIREMELSRDAEGVAAMFNACDLAWPSAFNEGLPMTAEMVREWHEEASYLVVYLAEVDGQIAGYASFVEGHDGQQGEGYLDLLSVDPAFHGHSIGRKLVQACVNRATKEKFKRHTLGTWSNNLKAVPAYKKTGHFWRPETSVWMQNYIPYVLQMPICAPFFERHDWYDSYVREIKQEEDDFRWEGLKVYPLRWEEGGESLTVWIDREIQAPVAIETDELFAAAIPKTIEALHGDEVQINWRITNKTDTLQRFLVDARGADGLEIDHREMFTVLPGATVEHVAAVKVTDEAPYAKDDGNAPSVRSVITFGHHDVELFSGVHANKPIEISASEGELSVSPGRAETITIQVQSRRAEDLSATLRLTPDKSMATSWSEQAVTLPAKGYVSLPVEITCERDQVYALEARLMVEGVDKPITETLRVFAVGAGGIVTHAEAKSIRIETQTLRIDVAAKQGPISLTDKTTRESLTRLVPYMGPPYYHTEAHRREYSLDLQQQGSRAVVRLQAESTGQPGLVQGQQLSVGADGLVEIDAWLENRGPETRTAAIRQQVQFDNRTVLQTAVPLAEGIVVAPGNWWPMLTGDIPREPAAYAEPWLAWEGQGIAAGLAWGSGVTQLRCEWSLDAFGAQQTLAPGERSTSVHLALFGQAGDWQSIRRRLCAWAGVSPQELCTRPVAEAYLDPQVVLTDQDTTQALLRIESASVRHLSAQVGVSSEASVAPQPASVALDLLTKETKQEQTVELAAPAAPLGISAGTVDLVMPIQRASTPFHVVRLGRPGEVALSQGDDQGQEVWRVDNGLIQFAAAPGYGPSVYSLLLDGKEQFFSNFPQAGGLAWNRPYFGGIHPLLLPPATWCFEGFLHLGRCSAGPAEATDRHGLAWRGVRLSAWPAQEKLRELLVELDVLTVPGAPVLKIVQRVINQRDAAREVISGLSIAPSLGAALTDLVLVGDGLWHQDTAIEFNAQQLQWGAVMNPKDGRTALLVSNRKVVGLWATGRDGRVLSGSQRLRLAAQQTHETVSYLVLAPSLQEAKRYTVLAEA